MIDLIHQIIDIAKNVAQIFDSSVLGPLTELARAIGHLLAKVLELAIMVAKWIIAKI